MWRPRLNSHIDLGVSDIKQSTTTAPGVSPAVHLSLGHICDRKI